MDSGSSVGEWMRRGLRAAALAALTALLCLVGNEVLAHDGEHDEGSGEATVTTDLPDYPPGATAYITGSGFWANEEVTLEVTHVHADDESDDSDPHHDPWTTTANEDGEISSSWEVCWECAGETLLLTATGTESQLVATHTFTDAATNLEGWKNDSPTGWTGSNITSSNSTYREGDTVPLRFTDNFDAGSTHDVTLSYDFSGDPGNADARFIDSLGSFDATVSLSDSDLTNGVTGLGSGADYTIPTDGSLPAGAQLAGDFRYFNMTINSIGSYSLTSGVKAITINFTVTGTSGKKNVLIGYGAHLAKPSIWGPTNGAAGFNGSSPKAYASSDGGSDKNLSISPGDIIPETQLVVSTATSVYGSGDTTLTATLSDLSNAAAINGATVNFTLFGASVGSAVTNSSGVASLTITDDATLAGKPVATYTGDVGASFAATASYSASSDTGDITVTKAPLSVTADSNTATSDVDAFTKAYDGAVFSPFTVRYSGFVNGDDAGDLTGTLVFSGAGATAVDFGTYTVTPGGLTSSNYDITFVDGSLSITKVGLTVTADADPSDADIDGFTKNYDGLVYTGFTVRYAGFVGGDGPGDLTGTLSFSGAGTTATAAGGPYPVTPGGLTSGNYDITFVDGSLTITRPTLTVTADADPSDGDDDVFTKIYDGLPYTGFTVRYDGFVNGDDAGDLGGTLAFSGDGTTATAAGGPYTVTPSGLTSSNYDISFVSGSVTITKKALSVTADSNTTTPAVDAFTKVYDGAVFSPFIVRYDGFVAGEDENDLGGLLNFSGDGTTAVNAGGPYTVTPGGLTSDNYEISFVDGSLTITKASLTITADADPSDGDNDVFTKTYDGLPFSGFTVRYDGFVGGDDEFDLGGALLFTGPGTTEVNAGGPYAVTPSGLTSGNYDIAFVAGSVTIGKKALSITADSDTLTPAIDAFTKTYDGLPYTGFTVRYDGFVGGDDEFDLGGALLFTGPGTTEFAAGGPYTVTPSGLTSSNYEINFVDGSVTITKKELSITADSNTVSPAVDAFTKVYDGAVFSPFTVRYSGFVGGDDEFDLGGLLNFSGPGTTATAAGGPYTVTPGGLTSSNYEITFVDGSLTITKKALSVTADSNTVSPAVDAFTKVYDGAVFSPFTVRYEGFIAGEDETYLGGLLNFTGPGTTATAAGGPYTVTPGGLTSSNYEISFFDGSLTITKKALSVTADSNTTTPAVDAFTKVYDGAVFSPFTVRYSGFVAGEDETFLGGLLNFSGPGTTAIAAGGPYVVTPGGLTSSNYEISFFDGSLTITKKALSVTADSNTATPAVDALTKVYDGAVFSPFTVRYEGFIAGEDETFLGGLLNFSGPGTTATAAGGPYTVTPGGLTSINYEITFVDGSLTITKKALSVTADSNTGTPAVDAFTKVYDGLVFSPFTVRYDGFVGGDDEFDLGGLLTFSGAGSTAVNVGGPYVVTPGGLTSGNYDITFVNGSLTITKAPLSITADSIVGTVAVDAFTKVYNGAVFSPFTARFAGLVNGELPGVLSGTLSFSGAGTTATAAGGPYVVTPGGLTSGNYDISFVNGSLTITQAPLSVTADFNTGTAAVDSFNKVYDGSAYSPFSVRYSGFIAGEGPGVLSGTLDYSGVGTTAVNAGGPYVVTPGGLTSSNYDISFVNGSVYITKAPLSITADADPSDADIDHFSRVFGDPNPPFTVRYAGFIPGEDHTYLGGTLEFDTTATPASNVGSYPVTPKGLTSGNYQITFVDGVLDIGRREGVVAYIGQTMWVTSGSSATTAQVTLSASFETDSFNVIGVNTSTARAEFWDITPGQGPTLLAGNLPVAPVIGAPHTGTVNKIVTLSTGKYGYQSYLIEVRITGNFTNHQQLPPESLAGSSPYEAAHADVVVMKPQAPYTLNGTGTFDNGTPAGSLTGGSGIVNDTVSYSVNLNYNKSFTNLQGQILLWFDRVEGETAFRYYIKSNSLSSMNAKVYADPTKVNTATVYAKASISKVNLDTGVSTGVDGNVTFRLDVVDGKSGNNSTAHNDWIAFTALSTKTSALFFSNNWLYDPSILGWRTVNQALAATAGVGVQLN